MFNPSVNTANVNALNGKINNFATGNFDCQGTFNVNSNLINIKKSNSIGIMNENPVYTVDVVGDINYTGKLLNNGNVVQTETYSTNNLWSKSGTYVFYQGNVIIGSNKQTSNILYVAGDSYFVNNLKCDGTITVLNLTSTGTIKGNNLTVDNLTVNKSATYNCNINAPNNNINALDITGRNLTLSGNANVSAGLVKCKTLQVENFENFNSTVTFGQNIIVIGKAFIQNDLIINTNKFVVNSATGDVSVLGGIVIGNTLRVNGTLTVINETSLNKTTINNGLTVNGDITASGNIYLVKSDAVFNTVKVNKDLITVNIYADTTGDVAASKFTVVGTNATNPVAIKYTTASTNATSGALVVSGGVGIGGNMNITGFITSSTGTSTFQNLTVNGSISCRGAFTGSVDSTFNTNLRVGQNLTVGGTITAANVQITGTGTIPTIQAGTITTTSNITCRGDLFVQGLTTLNGSVVAAGGLLLNSRIIPDQPGAFKIQSNYSGSVFLVQSGQFLRSINLPTPQIGLNYKIVIGPNYTQPSTDGFYVLLFGPTGGQNKPYGIINNNSVFTKIPGNTFQSVKMSFPAPGDVIEISSVLLNPVENPLSTDITFHIKIESSNSNAYSPTNSGPLPPPPPPT
jgi:cytoskeletal protein CcmA (bactofilin family)